jgi:hypothetical protein
MLNRPVLKKMGKKSGKKSAALEVLSIHFYKNRK